jgi:hypothetical protein
MGYIYEGTYSGFRTAEGGPVKFYAHQWKQVRRASDRSSMPGFTMIESYAGYQLGVGFFRRPDVKGHELCAECGVRFHDHGWIDGEICLEKDGLTVCPGDYVVVLSQPVLGTNDYRFQVLRPEYFHAVFKETT